MLLAIVSLSALGYSAAPAAGGPQPSEPTTLYKATFVRAAPGKLLDLVALYKNRMAVHDAAGDARPFWWRHAEGDQWDLMVIYPMGSYFEYYSKERQSRRGKAAAASSLSEKAFIQRLNDLTAWREDIFVMGPPLDSVKKAFEGTSFYHIEIFVSLPGRQEDLYRERVMENVYQTGIGRPETMIFVRDQGAAWDLFTLGCYKDIKHWAGTSDIPKDRRDAAARLAGFADADAIGPTMRTFIDMHRDTMGGAIK